MSASSVTTTLASNLCFGEGPRWRDGKLYFADMHDHWVKCVDDNGRLENVVEVAERPSGLGWLPDGDMLIVSMRDRRLLRYDGRALTTHSDLSQLASFDCNDMVVDAHGRAYVGNFGFDLHNGADYRAAELVCVDPDGQARVVADDLGFPNGTVITADGKTLIVAESFRRQLTAFAVGANGDLDRKREWAQLPDGVVPDGICLDVQGGIWVASPSTNECARVTEGGAVTHSVALDRGAFACMLGGINGRRLYICTSDTSTPSTCKERRSARIEVAEAPYPRAGFP